jgi:inosose dehydratase
MTIEIGNAPCSWGVEFANDPRNPTWRKVLQDCAEAGYRGIELGPVGFMPEDPAILGEALDEFDLTLIGGVIFRPYHDPDAWEDVLDATHRTARALKAHGAEHLVIIDSISPRRAPTAGRADEAVQMDKAEWTGFRDRIVESARIGAEDYGLTVGIHAHAAGFMDFEPELIRLLDEVDEGLLKICFDTGHHSYAGFDPVAFMKKYVRRISYMHFKDIDPKVKADVIANRTGFYEAVRKVLLDANFEGWCTVEQDCDPTLDVRPIDDARANRAYLQSIGF